jgi:hypothetical protein
LLEPPVENVPLGQRRCSFNPDVKYPGVAVMQLTELKYNVTVKKGKKRTTQP